MSQIHPPDVELARFGESQISQDLRAHIQECPRCRRVLVDYGWMEGEIAATLKARAQATYPPKRDWQTVRERMRRAEYRGDQRRWFLVAGVALVLFSVIGAPWLVGRRVTAWRVPAYPAVTAPAPPAAGDWATVTKPQLVRELASRSDPQGERTQTLVPIIPPPTPRRAEG